MSINSTNPATLFGGTWISWGAGRVPVGVNPNDTDFNDSQKTGGEKKHTLTVGELPSHSHQNYMRYNNGSSSGYGIRTENGVCAWRTAQGAKATGSGQSHNNMPPYITCYMWLRTE